jgi:hypothetical protein
MEAQSCSVELQWAAPATILTAPKKAFGKPEHALSESVSF